MRIATLCHDGPVVLVVYDQQNIGSILGPCLIGEALAGQDQKYQEPDLVNNVFHRTYLTAVAVATGGTEA